MTQTSWDLSGVYLRLERAYEHIETVHRETKAFLERDPKPLDFRDRGNSWIGQSD